MLRLRACVLSHLRSSPSVYPKSPLQRFLSATVPALPISPDQGFSVEDYLVSTCGLTRPPRSSPTSSPPSSPMRSPVTTQPERLRAMVACAERIGVLRGSGMFRQALQAVAFLSEEKIAAQVDYLKKTFRWSDTQVSIAVSRAPILLKRSEDVLRRVSEFLISEVELEPVYIAHRPVIINYVLRFLKANGLVEQNLDYYSIVNVSQEVFVKKFICPHKEAAPHLAEDYEAACKGEVPTRFRFT